jgi:myosin-5
LCFRWTYYDFYVRYRVLCHSRDVNRQDYRLTAENIVSKLISDEERYRFGKTKLFFRAGQVAYMEKLRGERLRDCGIMIQKHVKGFLYRKRFMARKNATLTMQRWVRGFLARRQARFMRRTRAAITIQKKVRGWVKRVQHQRLRNRTILLQARARGLLARRRHEELVRNTKAVILQKNVRGWIQKTKYRREVKRIVLVQGLIKMYLARKQLKKLKIEAKSVEHQKKLNLGLENKIISLQQKLMESKKINKANVSLKADHEAMTNEMDELRKASAAGKNAKKQVASLENELEQLREDLKVEKSEKAQLAKVKQEEKSVFVSQKVELESEVAVLKEELTMVAENVRAGGQVTSEELSRRMEEERAAIHAEYEQERIAYQKLLKDFNRQEAQLENLQDELMPQNRSSSNMSFMESELDLESAYGSTSARSSMRSMRGPPSVLTNASMETAEAGGDKTGVEDVALTVKLQQKLREAQRDRERMEKRLEDLEASKSPSNEKQTGDTIRVSEKGNIEKSTFFRNISCAQPI